MKKQKENSLKNITWSEMGKQNIQAKQVNGPFPSSCLPPLQNESKCEVFVMVISSNLHMNEN